MSNQTIAQLSNLGSPVTTRTISWRDQVQRAWGSEFKAPDHNIYRFTGRNFDSTDMGKTGIYGVVVVKPISKDPLSNTNYPDMSSDKLMLDNGDGSISYLGIDS